MNPPRLRRLEIAYRVAQARVSWQHPIYLVHALTARCNARCGFCAWNPDFYDPREQLGVEQIEQLYTDARRLGFVGLSIWGGEPLVYPHFARVVAHAHGLGLATSMVTNGYLLEQKLDAVVAHVDRVAISVDHPSSKHDEIRGIKGLFERIVSATRALRARAPEKPVVFVCTLQRANCDVATVREMAELLVSLGVVGVFNALREEAASSDAVNLHAYAPTQSQLCEAFLTLESLKSAGYPILNSRTHLAMMAAGPPLYRCHWPKLMLPVEANGDVVDCMHWGTRPVGSLKESRLETLLAHPRLRALAGPEGEACHKCVSLHRVEISEVWEGNLEPVWSWAQMRTGAHGGRKRAPAG